jgi:hypothetical protein
MKKFQVVRNEAIDQVIQFIQAWYANERFLKGENLYVELAKLKSTNDLNLKKICPQCLKEQSNTVKFPANGSVICNHCVYVNRKIRESKSKEDATFFSRKYFLNTKPLILNVEKTTSKKSTSGSARS